MRKKTFLIVLFCLILTLNLLSAIELDVSAKSVSNCVITDLNKPAIFDLTIRNLGENDDFEIYSLIGVDISPEAPFTIEAGKTKIIQIEIMPQEHIKSQKGYLTFEYKIKNSKGEIQKEKLTINIAGLKESFLITPENINPESEQLTITIKNKVQYDFDELTIQMDSAFFNYKDTISLKTSETKEFQITIDKEKIKTLQAGPYLLNTKINTREKTANIESIIKFLGQEGIETTETKEGILIKRNEITKTNVGNLNKDVKITAEKNLISYVLTTFNIAPEVQRQGFKITYTWEKELIPNEELKIVIKTNWLWPIFVIVFVCIIFILIKRYVESDLILSKRVSFVKTKGGEFALKVTLRAKAKSFIEKVHIIDKLPHLVKLYERFGAIAPDKIDLKNKRLEWDVESLNKGEERIFSYIIYSKIGIIGRFELPSAKAIYEKEGKIKEAESNRSFFINQPKE